MEQLVQQFFTDAALPFFEIISIFGKGKSLSFFLLIVFLLFGTAAGLRCGILFFSAAYLSFACKSVIADPRPYFVEPDIKAHSPEDGYGMPSGHTSRVSATLAPLIQITRSRILTIGVITIILLVALSRIYLGVHYLTQVLAGLILGIGLFVAHIYLSTPVVTFLKAQAQWVQALILALSLLILICLDVFVISAFPGIPTAEWQLGYDRALDQQAAFAQIGSDVQQTTTQPKTLPLIKPQPAAFYAFYTGFLIVAFIALNRGIYAVSGLLHAASNLLIGVVIIGGLCWLVFICLDIAALEIMLFISAPAICAFVIPAISKRWLHMAQPTLLE